VPHGVRTRGEISNVAFSQISAAADEPVIIAGYRIEMDGCITSLVEPNTETEPTEQQEMSVAAFEAELDLTLACLGDHDASCDDESELLPDECADSDQILSLISTPAVRQDQPIGEIYPFSCGSLMNLEAHFQSKRPNLRARSYQASTE
jgi:hypothetical protein